MKVVIDDKIPYIRGHVEQLADEVVYLPGSKIGKEDVRDADALLVRTRTRCDRNLLEGSRVRFIATATIGFDHLDTAYLDNAGIEWTNCPGCNATSVGQYVRNSLLLLEKAGMTRLSTATVGIVGYGHVGHAVEEALRPYVRRIIVNDPLLLENEERRVKSEELQQRADIITLHTPLTHDGPYPTYHLVDEEFLNSLQRQPVIINAARGGVVDEAALERALDEGRIRAAIIDTWENEPDIRLSLLDKTFIGTPHIAGYSADGKANATRMTLKALAQHFQSPVLNVQFLTPEAAVERTGLRYSPIEDSNALKEHPELFEKLRGDYPLRRE